MSRREHAAKLVCGRVRSLLAIAQPPKAEYERIRDRVVVLSEKREGLA